MLKRIQSSALLSWLTFGVGPAAASVPICLAYGDPHWIISSCTMALGGSIAWAIAVLHAERTREH